MLSPTVLRYAETRRQFAKPADLPAEPPMKVELLVKRITVAFRRVNHTFLYLSPRDT